ncbi:MoxR family ATPase [Eubacterium sp. OM08-24]|uniref:AAA family ATPase n=1 Tax=Eubacterium sp. OM08-24 TaxID=2292352 RepID=UPI000E44EFDF|nr:MoxR family ATPase [Eubacterium sp. OM08-24]RGM19257.1 MoxR family ATPase [Eubacterium sp. OM08-24]
MNEFKKVLNEIRKVINGKDREIIITMLALLANGNILIEDIPGVGKTTLVLAFSKALGLKYGRIQFTPDTLPSDITGFSSFNKESGKMHFNKGAIFCNLFLADELNRTSSRTQAALLEAMEERQVTVDGHSYALEKPFSVIATQNPVGASGTQLLPDSQTDRFTVRISMGYPDFDAECQMLLNRSKQNPLDNVKQVITVDELIDMQSKVKEVFVSEDMAKYIVMLVTATRQSSLFSRGASPRATLSLKDMAKAAAFADGRDYIVPRDIQNIFVRTISHRVILSSESTAKRINTDSALKEILRTTRQPKI